MQFRETDEEIFEDDPEEFIRRDIEGSGRDQGVFRAAKIFRYTSSSARHRLMSAIYSPTRSMTDIETRRRAAYDLIRGLCKCFEAEVTGVFSEYVTQLLAVRRARRLSTGYLFIGHLLVLERMS
jgi:exportin-2 (importin alpha re-exporter)